MNATRKEPPVIDRYVSFEGIECDRNAEAVIGHIVRLVEAGHGNDFWTVFLEKVERSKAGDTAVGDALFMVHSHINIIRDLFETADDEVATALLEKVEIECC